MANTCNVNVLAKDASCFFCLTPGIWPYVDLKLTCNAAGVNCDVQGLASEASCYVCQTPGNWPILEAILLCKIRAALGFSADCDPNTLMALAGCFSCLPPGEWMPLQMQLLCNYSVNPPLPPLPTAAILYDNMSGYLGGVPVNGLFGGVNGVNPTINWLSVYAARGAIHMLVYDNLDDYADNVPVNGLDGGVEVEGTWDSAYAAR